MGVWTWIVHVDPSIRGAWIGVIGALVGALVGAWVGGRQATKAAADANRQAWKHEADVRREEREQTLREALTAAWVELHAAAERGLLIHMRLRVGKPAGDEARQVLEAWAEFRRNCSLVIARARAAGYPGCASVIEYLALSSGRDWDKPQRIFHAGSELASTYIERPDALEKAAARDPEAFVRDVLEIIPPTPADEREPDDPAPGPSADETV